MRLVNNQTMVLVDVRGLVEFTGPAGHIPTSLNIPLDELPARTEELGPQNKAPIIIICKTDKRSAKAAQFLAAAGFENLAVLRGGVEAWRAAEQASHDTSLNGSTEVAET